MDLSHPLRSLVPSLDVAALEVLAGTESALGTSRIRELAGRGSWSGYQKVLDRLVEHGLVLSEPTNHGYSYRLNRDHLLAPAILAAVGVRRELLKRLTVAVGALDPQPEHASVFGSLARGEGSSDSDIDLFLVMPAGYDGDLEGWQSQLQALEERVLACSGNRLEVLVLDRDQLSDAAVAVEPVLASIRAEAIGLFGADVADMLPAGAA
jgi:predicted nucleotidyltransferase